MEATRWVPKLGVLVVRHMIGDLCNDVVLQFRDNQSDDQHYMHLAEMRDFRTRASFSPYVDLAARQIEILETGSVIIRRPASDASLEALIKLWADRQVSLQEWLEQVVEQVVLLDEEKLRLRRLVEKYTQTQEHHSDR